MLKVNGNQDFLFNSIASNYSLSEWLRESVYLFSGFWINTSFCLRSRYVQLDFKYHWKTKIRSLTLNQREIILRDSTQQRFEPKCGMCFFLNPFSDLEKYGNTKSFTLILNFSSGIFLFKINKGNSKTMCETCSELTIKIPEWRHWRH